MYYQKPNLKILMTNYRIEGGYVMQLKLSDISPGDIIEHESWGCNHGGMQERLTRRKGKVIQVTDKVITLQGKNYPETLLVNDLLSGRAKILKVRGEDTMARYDWDTLWPQVQELQAKGKSVTDIAIELGIDRKILTSKIYREKNKQTPIPEPDELGGTDPEQGESGSAGDSVLDNNEQRQTEDDKAIVAHMRYAFSELFGAPDDGGFTAADEEPIPYILVPDHHNVAEEIACLLDRKGQDYGTENIKKFGSYGVLVRVSDKVERLINLSKRNNKPNFESVEDTWRDIAGYAILALIELREGR
jgi:hypothetical protein